MKKSISMIAGVGIASVALLSVACSGDDGPTPIPGGSGGTTGATGGTTGGVTGGTTGATGGADTGATGGADTGTGGPVSDFVVGGRGTVAPWDGYLFTVANLEGTNADGEAYAASTIMPAEFTGATICATGTLAADYEAFGMIGWNIAQEIDEDGVGSETLNEILPVGTGVSYNIQNNEGGKLRIQIQDNSNTDAGRWCADVPADGGSGTILWGDFSTLCWGTDGVAYDAAANPISQIVVQKPADGPAGETAFDYCVVHLGPAM